MNKVEKRDISFSLNPFTFTSEKEEYLKGNAIKVDLTALLPEEKSRIKTFIKDKHVFVSEGENFIRFITDTVFRADLDNINQSARTREILKSFLISDFIEQLAVDLAPEIEK